MMLTTLYFTAVFAFSAFARDPEENPRHRLASTLFENYKSYLRPYCGIDKPTNVTLDLSLRQLVALDEPIQMLKVNLWIRMQWVDCHLVWNSSEYNGIDNIVVPYDQIWIPDLTLYDSVATETRGYTEFRPVIYANGSVHFKFPLLVESQCVVNVRDFPFDTQNCRLKYGSWAQNGLEVDFWPKNPYGDLDETVENTEWDILEFTANRNVKFYNCCPEPFPDVTFVLMIKRKPLFYIINIIIPTFLITLIGILVFGLPVESGEKVSLEITIMLSLAVFQLLVADNMPPSAATVPLIAIYFDFSLFLIGFACVMSVVSINMYFRENSRMSQPFRKIFLCCFAKLTMVRVPEEFKHEVYVIEQNNKEAANHCKEPCLHPDTKVNTKEELELGSFSTIKSKERHKKISEGEWKLASRVVDRISCVIFILLLTIVTFSIFVQYS